MKTIATAAVLMMLAGIAWADDADKQTNGAANSNQPIVLSEAELDGVTAGILSYWDAGFVTLDVSDPANSTSSSTPTSKGIFLVNGSSKKFGYADF